MSVCAAPGTDRDIAAFEDFLHTFKSATSEAQDALEDLALGDGDSEEYDFMDDSDDADNAGEARGRSSRRRPASKQKYVQMLQDVANRQRTNIVVDLDDLEAVRPGHSSDAPDTED